MGKSSRRACSKFSAPLVRKRWITCGTSRDSALLPENYVSKKRKAGQEILSRNIFNTQSVRAADSALRVRFGRTADRTLEKVRLAVPGALEKSKCQGKTDQR